METDQINKGKDIKPANLKASIVTTIFLLEGVFSYFYNGGAHPALALFYLILCFNTFFSIRFFSSIIPIRNINQDIIDVVLFLIYPLLAWHLHSPMEAMMVTVVLFVVATYKYVHMITYVPYPKLLRRKISVDNAGALVSFVVCIGIIITGSDTLLWYWTAIFAVGNIYLFIVRPLYRIQ